IEFGERGEEALIREIDEELSLAVADVRFRQTFENIFVYEGKPGHEILLVYEAAFADSAAYTQSEFEGRGEHGDVMRMLWKPLEDFRAGAILYPEGLLRLL